MFFALFISYLTGLIFIYCWYDTRHWISLYSQSAGIVYPRICKRQIHFYVV